MSTATEQQINEFAASLVQRIVADLGLTRSEELSRPGRIRNLQGQETGFLDAYVGPGIYKLTHLSINVMPGARYFNIMLTPEADLDAPRFAHEGMLMAQGSQISTDIYHSVDQYMEIESLIEKTRALTGVFEEAKASGIAFVPSRQVHMRVFCSPHFLNVFGATGDQLPRLAEFATRYYEEWQKMFKGAARLEPSEAKRRQQRRRHMSDMVIKLDPDRQMVVQVYGEETIAAIERAVMY